jgi:TetR/AcrR family transcriptional regulator
MRTSNSKSKKDHILEAAIAEYARFGLKGARVDRIARRAVVNKRMLYYYFGSKDDLYRTALHKVYQGITESMGDYIEKCQTDDPVEKVMSFLGAYFNYMHGHPEYVAMIAWENLQRGRYVEDAEVEGVTHPMVDYATKLLVDEKLLLDDLDVRHYMVQALGAAFFYYSNQYTLSLVFGPDLYLDDEAQRYLKHVKKVLSMPLKRRRSSDASSQAVDTTIADKTSV